MTQLLDVHVSDKRFGERRILHNVSVDLREGEVASLVGPSGCGKSTLLRIIAGLDRDYQGEVILEGRRLTGRSPQVGFIFQEPRLLPWLSVGRNVAFGDAGRTDAAGEAERLLAEVGLAGFAEALPRSLSGGQAQRVAIARGLFTRPRLLLLDEPFSAVDAFTRMKLQDLLREIARLHGITLLLVTHDIDEALYLSDRVFVMGANPGIVRQVVKVPLPQPRDRRDESLAREKAGILTELYAAHAI